MILFHMCSAMPELCISFLEFGFLIFFKSNFKGSFGFSFIFFHIYMECQ